MSRLGFVQSKQTDRIAVRNCQGNKVGYLCSENGRQVYRSVEGRMLAIITKFNTSALSRTGAFDSQRSTDW